VWQASLPSPKSAASPEERGTVQKKKKKKKKKKKVKIKNRQGKKEMRLAYY